MQRSEPTYRTFTDEDLNGIKFPYDDPLVITALIVNHNIYRVLVDIGATSNLMYFTAFKVMGFTTEHLIPSSTTLLGFQSKEPSLCV